MKMLGAALALSTLALGGCDETTVKEAAPGGNVGPSGGNDGGGTGPDGGSVGPDGGDCFPNPKTHYEIINRCSTSQRIDKTTTLSGLLPDGGLPPLP